MKNLKRSIIVVTALLACAITVFSSFAATRMRAVAAEVTGTGKAAYLIDSGTGTVISEKNSSERLPIASMVKITTLLVAFEEIEKGKVGYIDDVVASEYAASMGGSQAFLDANSSYKMDELLKSIVVASANDSCVAVGEHLFGSADALIARMNEKAAELGLTDTAYVNCTGLPAPGQYSTAHDVAKLFSELIKHEKFFEYSGVWMYDFVHPSGRVTGLTNTNKLIRFYEGCDGGKTGYTSKAGSCLAATASRGGMRLIAVVIGANDSKLRNKEVSDLFNYGFANYAVKTIVNKGESFGTVEVSNGKTKTVDALAANDYAMFGKKGENLDAECDVIIEKTAAPLAEGEIIGYVRILVGGEEVGRVNLVSSQEVLKRGFFDILNDTVSEW